MQLVKSEKRTPQYKRQKWHKIERFMPFLTFILRGPFFSNLFLKRCNILKLPVSKGQIKKLLTI
jgi:hypothetical protein